MKPNGTVRICADFKMTVNPNLHTDKYSIPRIEELFAKLTGGVHFLEDTLNLDSLNLGFFQVGSFAGIQTASFGTRLAETIHNQCAQVQTR